MPRIGTIVQVTGDHALIETTRRGICDGCSDHAGCAVEGDPVSGAIEKVLARNPIQAVPGDRVEFELTGHTELRLSLLVWGVPLVGLMAGAAVGANLHEAIHLGRDVATLLGAVGGGALAFGIVVLFDRRARGDERLVPEVLKVVPVTGCSLPSSIDDSSCAPPTG